LYNNNNNNNNKFIIIIIIRCLSTSNIKTALSVSQAIRYRFLLNKEISHNVNYQCFKTFLTKTKVTANKTKTVKSSVVKRLAEQLGWLFQNLSLPVT